MINILAYADQTHADQALEHSPRPKSLGPKELEFKRKAFIKAEEALKNTKDLAEKKKILYKNTQLLLDYPLLPYLELMYLQQSIENVSLDNLLNFTQRYPYTPLSKNLRESWLLHNAKIGQWKNFIKGYDEQEVNSIELECYFIQAQSKFKPNLGDFNDKIKKLWLSANHRPNSCDVVFSQWHQEGLMSKAMIWQRIKLAIMAKNFKFAIYLAKKYLTTFDVTIVELWLKVQHNPSLVKHKSYFPDNYHPAIPEILMYGMTMIAKNSPEEALQIWANLARNHKFTHRHYNNIVKSIAMGLARNSDERSWNWFKKISAEYRDQESYNLQLILALKNTRWSRIIELYDDLPTALKNEEKWLYWYARALEMQQSILDSKKILIELATKRSYYGFLSSAKLLRPYSFKFKPVQINAKQMDAILCHKSLQRAYELLQIDRLTKASQEWNVALKNMVEWELHAAAKLAESLNMPNWAILALSDAKQKDDLSLRFPQYYSNYILNEAQRNHLDPAWVFAITRQESAFRPYVKSYAGALGLMQIMPKTGLMVARTLNLELKNHNDLLDVNKNVKLGSKYLQLMLDKYKNLAVATAAYNAGPGRIQKWLPPYDLAADIWIETIPFNDTRDYVQNVMTYTVIYQKLLGRTHYLNMPLVKKI